MHSRDLSLKIAAGAGVHGGGEHKARGKTERHGGARDGDGVILERLAHDFEHVAREFRQLVEKEEAVVRERYFAGARHDAAADEAGVGDGVVRRAKGPLRDEARAGFEHAGNGVNLGGFERFFKGERGQDRRQALGEHGFAGAGRPDHENVVAAGRGHFERALGGLLAAHIAEVDAELLELAEEFLGRDAVGLALDDADDGSVEQIEHIEQRGDGIDVDAFDDRGFGGVGGGQNQVGNAFFAGQDGNGQHAGDGAHAAVEAQLADHEKAAEVSWCARRRRRPGCRRRWADRSPSLLF